MNNFSSSETSNDRDEYSEVTQADLVLLVGIS